MIEHVKEAPHIRNQVMENATKLKNYDSWIPKIESKVDRIPEMLSGFYIKTILSIGALNVGTMVIMKFIGGKG